MSVLSTIMCVLHEPPRCRGGPSSESHPLELELLTVVSCCLAVSLHAQREIPSNSLSWEISPQSCGTMMVLRKEKMSWDCTTGVKVLASENSLCPLQIINNPLFCSVNFVFPFPPLLWTLDKNGESTTLWHSGVNRNFWRSGEFRLVTCQLKFAELTCCVFTLLYTRQRGWSEEDFSHLNSGELKITSPPESLEKNSSQSWFVWLTPCSPLCSYCQVQICICKLNYSKSNSYTSSTALPFGKVFSTFGKDVCEEFW